MTQLSQNRLRKIYLQVVMNSICKVEWMIQAVADVDTTRLPLRTPL